MICENRQYMEKLKYPTRKFIIIGESQRDLALAALKNAPIGIEVVLREPVNVRSLDQNGLYWKRLSEIQDQAWLNGQQYSKETWHHYCAIHVMMDNVTTKDGEIRSKMEPTPDGSPCVISTTKLEKKCFAEYVTAVEAFGCSLGVQFSANPNGY